MARNDGGSASRIDKPSPPIGSTVAYRWTSAARPLSLTKGDVARDEAFFLMPSPIFLALSGAKRSRRAQVILAATICGRRSPTAKRGNSSSRNLLEAPGSRPLRQCAYLCRRVVAGRALAQADACRLRCVRAREDPEIFAERFERLQFRMEPHLRSRAAFVLARDELDDRRARGFADLALRLERHALRPPLDIVAQIGEGEPRIFLDDPGHIDTQLLRDLGAAFGNRFGDADAALHLVAGISGILRFEPGADRGLGCIAVFEIFGDEALLAQGEPLLDEGLAWRALLSGRIDAVGDPDTDSLERGNDFGIAQHLRSGGARGARRITRGEG